MSHPAAEFLRGELQHRLGAAARNGQMLRTAALCTLAAPQATVGDCKNLTGTAGCTFTGESPAIDQGPTLPLTVGSSTFACPPANQRAVGQDHTVPTFDGPTLVCTSGCHDPGVGRGGALTTLAYPRAGSGDGGREDTLWTAGCVFAS